MNKVLDISKSIFDLTKEYPEIINIMKSLGFEKITDPLMLSTAGRYMTIPKGASMKKIDLETIIKELEAKGFIIRYGGNGYE
ncbi:MAG: DUF1858 domain-containing protein [Acetivibrionales bacterium]|jgi:hypothetical protein